MKTISKDNKKNLFLITSEYPYGKGETFIENELKEFSTKFDTIFIFPLSKRGAVVRYIPENGKIMDFLSACPVEKISETFTRHFFYILKVLFWEFIHADKKKYFLKNIKDLNNFLCQNIQKACCLKPILEKESSASDNIFYSFWMNEGSIIYSILKDMEIIKNFVFRVSGYDLYDERRDGNYMPFRYLNFSRTNKVFCVSKTGMEYVKAKNIFPQKVTYSHFGTNDYGLSSFSASNQFTIYSCSSIIAIKRVELIAEILKNVSFDIKWIHRGDGPLKERLLNITKSLPGNITFELLEWAKDYNDVITHVKSNSINLFINVSESEGLPVTVIEATSFGIPVLATNVGGTNEVVTKDTGILIEKKFVPEEAAKIISEFKNSPMNTIEFRKKVKAYWEENFSASVNYQKFYNQLIESV